MVIKICSRLVCNINKYKYGMITMIVMSNNDELIDWYKGYKTQGPKSTN